MLLSVQQTYILEILRRTGCIRRRQLFPLVREKFRPMGVEISEHRLEVMLRQLRHCVGEVRMEEELVRLSHARPDPRRLEAVDVMLELSGGAPVDFSAVGVEPPFLLRFSFGQAPMRFFSVGTVSDAEHPFGLYLKAQKGKRVVWLSDDGVPPAGLILPPKHFFAARTGGVSHRFYGSQER